MLPSQALSLLAWLAIFVLAFANPDSPYNGLQLRDTIDRSSLRRYSPIVKRTTYNANATATLDKSWNDATIFNVMVSGGVGHNTTFNGDVDIICTTCYIKGVATAHVTTTGNFNLSQALTNFTSNVEEQIGNVTNTTVTDLETWVHTLEGDFITFLENGDYTTFVDELTFPTLNNTNFDLTLPPFPSAQLTFQIDGFEIYVAMDMNLSASATYTFSIFKPETPVGIYVDQDFLGIIFEIDLILSSNGEIDMSSGFHIKLNDGFVIDMELFNNNVSSITNNGGHFEFLPVTVQAANIQLNALLKVGLKAGLNIDAPPFKWHDITIKTFSAGALAGAYMTVAEFTTNVTQGSGNGCDFLIDEAYTMAVGAQAGATLALGAYTWGPTPTFSTIIYETTLASHCVLSGTPTPASLTARAVAINSGVSTTTLSTTETYTATQCLQLGLLDCPISLQSTSKQTVTSTTTLTYSGSSVPTYPASILNSVDSTIPFSSNVHALATGSGNPSSFNPTASPPLLDRTTDGVSNKIIIGVCVGGGVLLLLAIGAGIAFCVRRRKLAVAEMHRGSGVMSYNYSDQPMSPEPFTPGSDMSKKGPYVGANEMR